MENSTKLNINKNSHDIHDIKENDSIEEELLSEMFEDDTNDGGNEYIEDNDYNVRNHEIDFTGEAINNYFNLTTKFISSEQSTQLLARYKEEIDPQKKETLLNEIVMKNSGLVVSIAKRYASLSGTTLEDIMQAGMVGLLKAIEKFKPEKGFAFSTYATHWIRQSITREYGNTHNLIRKPIHFAAIEYAICKFVSAYSQTHCGEYPDDETIAEGLGITVEKIQRVRAYSSSVISYDMPIASNNSSDEDMNLLDVLSTNSDLEKEYAQKELTSIIKNELMSPLNDKEKRVINKRFGLDDGIPHTLEDVGQEMGVTRERIRQIESAALKKMRIRALRKNMNYQILHVSEA